MTAFFSLPVALQLVLVRSDAQVFIVGLLWRVALCPALRGLVSPSPGLTCLLLDVGCPDSPVAPLRLLHYGALFLSFTCFSRLLAAATPRVPWPLFHSSPLGAHYGAAPHVVVSPVYLSLARPSFRPRTSFLFIGRRFLPHLLVEEAFYSQPLAPSAFSRHAVARNVLPLLSLAAGGRINAS